MAGGVARRSGKKNRKHLRSQRGLSKANYNKAQRWLVNKEKKLKRHLKKHPNDKQATSTEKVDYRSKRTEFPFFHVLWKPKLDKKY